MHSNVVSQVFTAWPDCYTAGLFRQPSGSHQRRSVNDKDRKKFISKALELGHSKQISGKARDYLVEWARGCRRRIPRPPVYEFLNHSHSGSRLRSGNRPAALGAGQVLRVQVHGIAGQPLPDAADSGDDAEEGELVCAAG